MQSPNPTHCHFNSMHLPAKGKKIFPLWLLNCSELPSVWTSAMTWQSIVTPDTNTTDGFNYVPPKNFKFSRLSIIKLQQINFLDYLHENQSQKNSM